MFVSINTFYAIKLHIGNDECTEIQRKTQSLSNIIPKALQIFTSERIDWIYSYIQEYLHTKSIKENDSNVNILVGMWELDSTSFPDILNNCG